ncbi:GOLPH3/VPS74 family protein [Actinoplanes solisilvae]|uniref:GOLPH3/VPS74 family protein n=1 Tax=Actinoplanes solisilvae TaxID=2486853 RepID=UPI0013E30935|nr:GPP34 family phosphoprotein [Actinoplanes solisilvae]
MTQRLGPPILAEDLLLLLFQPSSGPAGTGVVAGEETLPYVLAGAMLADLSIGRHVRTVPGWSGSTRVEAVAERPPADDLLRSAWDYLVSRPRGVQATLALIGPALRRPLLERLIERNDVHRSTGAETAAPTREILTDGESGRRRSLLRGVRHVLAGEAEPEPRLAALVALLSGSGMLPQFHPEISRTPASTARAKQLEHGVWAADAAADAIARSFAATIVDNVIFAAAVLPRR